MVLQNVFLPEDREQIQRFYDTYEPNFICLERYKKIPPREVRNLFYGDSITAAFPLQDLFPGVSLINRGLPGDHPAGLYLRLERDLFAHHPKRVFLWAGINGINREEAQILLELTTLAALIRERGSEVYLCSILPLRPGDKWDRYQYQDKICRINEALQDFAARQGMGYLDYHRAVRDEKGDLAAPYARPDGTHVTVDGYLALSKVLQPYLL